METFRRPPVRKVFDYEPDIPQNIKDVVIGHGESVQGNRLLHTAATARAAALQANSNEQIEAAAQRIQARLSEVHECAVECSMQTGLRRELIIGIARAGGTAAFPPQVWDIAVVHACRDETDSLAIKLGIPPAQLGMEVQDTQSDQHVTGGAAAQQSATD